MFTPDTLIAGRYRIVRKIGQGGMGAVYEAMDERLRGRVALKQTLVTEDALKKAFEREAQLLANLRHPNLPRVIDHFVDSAGQFLVMDYVIGKDLAEILQERGVAFPAEMVLRWADQLLNVLDYLHSHNPPIIHRDIKPQNAKVTTGNQLILLDFGLAKGSPVQTRATSGSSIVAYTPSYAALEQIHGSGTDERSDLYSLGATLYNLLTNQTPIDALTRSAAMINQDPDPQRPAHSVNPQVPPAISGVVMQAMAMRARDRPASAAVMREWLQAAASQGDAAEGTIISTPPPASPDPTIVASPPTQPYQSWPATQPAPPPISQPGQPPHQSWPGQQQPHQPISQPGQPPHQPWPGQPPHQSWPGQPPHQSWPATQAAPPPMQPGQPRPANTSAPPARKGAPPLLLILGGLGGGLVLAVVLCIGLLVVVGLNSGDDNTAAVSEPTAAVSEPAAASEPTVAPPPPTEPPPPPTEPPPPEEPPADPPPPEEPPTEPPPPEEPPTEPPPPEEPPAEPVNTDANGVPIFPNAEPLPPDSPIIAALRETEAESAEEINANAYSIPAAITFDQVKEFYAAELIGRGWVEAEDSQFIPPEENPGGGSAGWQNGETEAFAVITMADPIVGDRQILITVYGQQ